MTESILLLAATLNPVNSSAQRLQWMIALPT
jgi:hypothetical protein